MYRVHPNTSQVIVTLTNFQTGPPAQQNQLVGDLLTFGIHSARTTDFPSDDIYVSPLEHLRNGMRIVNNPDPGLMRIAVNGSWRNAGDVSVDVSVMSLTDSIPQFTQQGQIAAAQTIDWGNYPSSDIDVLLVSPSGKLNLDGATENNPEYVSIQQPEAGNWIAMINGFDIPAGSDKYEFRIELDGKVIHQ